MDNKILNSGQQQQKFMLAIENATGTPAWISETDELWLRIVAAGLYKCIKAHPFFCINSRLENDKDFAATMTIDNFKTLIMEGEADRFHQYAMQLIEFTIMNVPIPSNKMYLTFCVGGELTDNDHVVNAIVEYDKGLIIFGAQIL